MKKIEHITLLTISIIASTYLNAQSLKDSILVKISVDSIESYGPTEAFEPFRDTTVRLYCNKKISVTIILENNSKRQLQILQDPNTAGFAWSVIDYYLERFDDSLKTFVDVTPPLSDPMLYDSDLKFINFLPGQRITQSVEHSYITRINELNRLRLCFTVLSDKTPVKIYSGWTSVPWKTLDHPWKF